jgi:hydroxymethylpyrimidine pyrophosphatase-like HAD family hydrolase
MPLAASKSNAIRQLKAMLGCDRLVVFGDGKNDIDMFQLADESYAVENAAPELKAIATGVIGSNNDDSVAHWLLEHAQLQDH